MHPRTPRRLGPLGRIVLAVLGLQFVLLGPALLELHAPHHHAGDSPAAPTSTALSSGSHPEVPGEHRDDHDCRMCALWLSAPSLPGTPTVLAPLADTRMAAAYQAMPGVPVPVSVPQPPIRAPPRRA